jgi:hypothetical protein
MQWGRQEMCQIPAMEMTVPSMCKSGQGKQHRGNRKEYNFPKHDTYLMNNAAKGRATSFI